MWDEFWKDRGKPWEHDPGPAPTSHWARLFAETPNYRGIGKAVTGSEAFRWHFGPMFYRGRLGDGQVRVLVIGQEGAQDESLAHRSFVGGTGARMQHFLKHIGITHSYLFLNTFVYPIFGQYDDDLLWLAQNLDSPIVKHRHAIFDAVAARNDLRLIVAVGRAAKESVTTWIKARGGSCTQGATDISRCDASVIGPRAKAVGVVHPGGAGKGASVSAIVADFKKAINKIKTWADADTTWLPPDPGATRQNAASYKYKRAPIPFRDLPFGIAWRIGRGGTSSNRQDAQRSIQIFSDAGKYNGKANYIGRAAGSRDGYVDETGDLPYEPPRKSFDEFDRGPDAAMASLLMGGAADLDWPDFSTLGVRAHQSLGFGPIYRGRFSGVKLLVLGDQESHDDLFNARALTGEGGQHFQGFLAAMGIVRSYLILRTLPVDTLGLSTQQQNALVDNAKVKALYQEVIQRVLAANTIGLMLTIGAAAKRLAGHVVPSTVQVVHLKSWHESGALNQWKQALETLKGMSFAKDVTNPSFSYEGLRGQIPRFDLPYGTLRWQGTSGDRALRATGDDGPNYYKIHMPIWAFELAPAALTQAEQDAVNNAPD